jgi:probable F420-dependent oxidoreductase
MEFGVRLPGLGGRYTPEAIVRMAQRAEELGYDALWAPDHIVIPVQFESRYPYSYSGRFPFPADAPFPEAHTLLSFLASVTRRVRLGTSVMIMPLRNPVLNAKMLATLQYLSGGRLVLGAGVGWLREEGEAMGVPWDHRGQRTDEHIQLMRALWTQEDPRFEGRFYRIAGVRCEPRPPVPPPVWVGGHGEPALRRVARLGDGWITAGGTPDEIAPLWQQVQQLAQEHGRDPASITFAVQALLRLRPNGGGEEASTTAGDDRIMALRGSPSRVTELVDEFRRVGVQHLILVPPFRPGPEVVLEMLELFAREVRPAFV